MAQDGKLFSLGHTKPPRRLVRSLRGRLGCRTVSSQMDGQGSLVKISICSFFFFSYLII